MDQMILFRYEKGAIELFYDYQRKSVLLLRFRFVL